MALVGFQRNGDAALAANKYDGRFVDNSKLLLPASEPSIHTRGVRTTVESRSYRGQGRSRSLEKVSCQERIAIPVAAADVSTREDEYRTGKRTRPVRTPSFTEARARVPFTLTAYLCWFYRPKAPKQQTQKAPVAPAEAVTKPKAVPTKRKKTKKGPARLTKKKATVQELDEEMDAYRAAVPQIGGDLNRMVI